MAEISKIYNSITRRVQAWSRKGKTKEQCDKMMTIKHKKSKASKPYDPDYSQEEIKERIAKHKAMQNASH
tara:strand:- start:46 stop:255 length:210 start_codon:yes stop_codon:yes gene_type:complete